MDRDKFIKGMETNMKLFSIDELIKKAHEENVRIEVEITPDICGNEMQRITIEPFVPYEPHCPYGMMIVADKEKKE